MFSDSGASHLLVRILLQNFSYIHVCISFLKSCELVACQRFRRPRSLAHDYINVCQVSWLILVCRRERCVCIYINNIYKYSNSSTLEVCALQCMLEIYFVRAIKARELMEHCWVTDVIVSLFKVGSYPSGGFFSYHL